MEPVVTISKITPPRLSKVVHRSRLIESLDKNRDKKLTLILGQAAQGKSTLAASYVDASRIPSAWINLGQEDSDPVNLYYALVHALQFALKEVDPSLLMHYPSLNFGPRPKSALYRDWVQTMLRFIVPPVDIFLDQLDRLSSDSSSFLLLQTLLEHLPPGVRLILLSREIPSLEIESLQVRQEAHVMTNEELAFRLDETGQFFKKVCQRSFTANQLQSIHSLTEGWAGGLILLSEVLDRLPEESRRGCFPEGFPDRFRREVFQYFGEEIFSSQPREVQEFLVRSSVLDLIKPGLMKDFMGVENSGEILQDLWKRNVFVQSVHDEDEGWLFRYHQLFRDFLLARLESWTHSQDLNLLYLSSGTLYEQGERPEEAVRYYLKAKAYYRAAALIERIGMHLIREGRNAELSQWIDTLPEDLVKRNPWLLFYLVMTRRFTGMKQNIFDLENVLKRFKQKGDVKGHILSLAYLIESLINTGQYANPIRSLVREGRDLLVSLESDVYLLEKAFLSLQVGLGHIRIEGNIRSGISACQRSYLIARQMNDIDIQLNALIHSIVGSALLGEFSFADEARGKINKIVKKSVYPELSAMQLMAEVIVSVNRGDFHQAPVCLKRLRDEIQAHGLMYLEKRVSYYDLLVKVYLEEYVEAEQLATRLLNISSATDDFFLKAAALGTLGLTHYHKGDFDRAIRFTELLVQLFLSLGDPHGYHFHLVKEMMGLICYHLEDYQRSEQELEEALSYFTGALSHISIAETHLAFSLLKWHQRRIPEAVQHLRAGFEIAERMQYVHFTILSRSDLLRACLLALEMKVLEAVEYAGHLLSTRLASLANPELKELSNHPDLWLRDKVREIRRAIHRSGLSLIQIRCLGYFQVQRQGALIEDWKTFGSKPKQLLKAVVARGSRKIPKDLLEEDLWPMGRPSAVEKSFKTVLYRLRRALEPSIKQEFGSSYVHLKDNFVSLDEAMCQVDVESFLSLIERGKAKENEGDLRAAIDLYEEAARWYAGDFLPEELYAPWADLKREELRRKYIGLLYTLAEIYERRGASKKAITYYKRVIELDPLQEEAYQRLMVMYSNRGMRSAALRTYEDCKKSLQDVLNVEPDRVTTALCEKILEIS